MRGVLAQKGLDQPDDLPDGGWARLSDRIDREAPARTATPKAANDNWFRPMSLLQAACIAALAIFGWQAVQTNLLGGDADGYVTASAESDGPSLRIVFADDAALRAVSETLLALDGRIVSGPSALGLYAISFPDDAMRDAAFDALSARPDLIAEVVKD